MKKENENEICNSCDQGPCGGKKVLTMPEPLPEEDLWLAEDPQEKKMNGEIFTVIQQITQKGRKFSYISSPKFYDNNPITVVPSDWLKETRFQVFHIGKKFGVGIIVKGEPRHSGSLTPARFFSHRAALRAIELIKEGVSVNDVDDNGIFHEGYRDD